MQNFHGAHISPAQTKFYFIFAPNNSGSTVLSQYISAQLGGYLTEFGNNEGINIPSVSGMMRKRRWDSTYKYDWPFIRGEWEKHAKGKTFIEGSPSNLVRFREIAETFGDDSSAISLICSPYQQIASCVRRYKSPPFSPATLVDRWLVKANGIREFRQTYTHFPALTYKEFTAAPETVNDRLGIPIVHVDVVGKKGSDAKSIEDQSAAAILFLTEQEIDGISQALSKQADLMAYFGFDIMSGRDLHALCAQNAQALAMAKHRRNDWETGKKHENVLGRLVYEMRVLIGR